MAAPPPPSGYPPASSSAVAAGGQATARPILPSPSTRPPLFSVGRPSSSSVSAPRAPFLPIRPTGHIRNPNFAAALAAASQQAQHRVPFSFSDNPPRFTQPPAPQLQHPRPARPPATPMPRAPNTSHKVSAIPAVPSTTENNNNNKEREKAKDEFVATVHGRKVRLSDCSSGSLYALCRSWVRNGVPQDRQPCPGDIVRDPSMPLSVSYTEARPSIMCEDDNEADDFKNEQIGLGEHLSSQELLQGHIKRAKRVRAFLAKEHAKRIQPYKHRLSLLLRPPADLGIPDEPNPGG